MKVLVTGATGFVGRHVVAALLERGHGVIAAARTEARARALPWFSQADFIECDVHRDGARLLAKRPDVLVHLAWPGLPNYDKAFHLQETLPAELRFLTEAVSSGIGHVVVAGTCLEYGLQNGPLAASAPTRPVTPYGQAKDSLRKALEALRAVKPFTLQWVRLFYMYGEGQNPNSLLSQLDRAIAEGKPDFNMSRGDQLRDYQPIEAVAAFFARLVETPGVHGAINSCSGKPVSVRELVEQRCALRGSGIALKRGHYDYPAYEPLAFWGIPNALESPPNGTPRELERENLEKAVAALEVALEDAQGEGELQRMRLLEAVQWATRESARAALHAQRITELDATVAGLHGEVGARDARIAQQASDVQARDSVIAAKQAELEARDAIIAAKEAELQARAATLARHEGEIARLGAILAQDGHRLITRVGAMVERHPALRALLRAPIRLAHWLMNRF